MTAVKSGLFSLAGGLSKVLIGVIGLVVFGRLLSPDIHGIYVYILAIHAVVLPFLEFGLLPAYLKIDKVNKEANSVFFSLNVLIGIVLTLTVVLIAPALAAHKANPDLQWYIWAYAVVVLIISLGNQPAAQLIKQKRFKEIAIIDGFSALVALICGVVFAQWGWAVWALLLRFIIDVTIKLGLQAWRVKPIYQWVNKEVILKYWESIKFGAGIAVSRIITGLSNSTDKFIFEEMYGGGSEFSALGHYGKSADATTKADLIRNSLTTPALSYLTAIGVTNSRKYYFDLTHLFFFATALPILYFVVYGDLFTIILLGEQWGDAAIYSRFLAFYAAGWTLRGLVNIFHINEFKSSRLYKVNLTFFILVFSGMILAYISFRFDSYRFVQIFSIVSFTFWLVALIQSLWSFTGDLRSALRTLFNILVVVSVFILIGLWLRDIFRANHVAAEYLTRPEIINEFLKSIVVGLISLLAAILAYALINRSGFKRQLQLVLSRLK